MNPTTESRTGLEGGKPAVLPTVLLVLSLFAGIIDTVNADNIIIIEYGAEGKIGDPCTNNYECLSWLCSGGFCAACSTNTDCSGTTRYCVAGSCTHCSAHPDCDTLWCEAGSCRTCSSDSQCPSRLCDEATGMCQRCTNYTQCTTGFCEMLSGYCMSCTTDAQCEFGLCSIGSCVSCQDLGCLSGWKCRPEDGKCYCKDNGEACAADGECCSGKCAGGKCIPVIVEGGKTTSSGYSRGAGSSGAVGGEQRVVREVERKATSAFLVNIFGWSKTKVEEETTCIRGSLCATSADCCGADCVDSACLCSTKVCSVSGECCAGYCEGGLCRTAPVMSLFVAEALKKPVTAEVGCAGLVEECLPGEQSCFSICNALTGLLLVVSAGTGGIVWRRIGHPVPGIVAAFVPIGVGLMFYPFVGMVVGLLTLALLALRMR